MEFGVYFSGNKTSIYYFSEHFHFLFIFETRSLYVAWACLKFMIFLPQLPKYWDCRHARTCPTRFHFYLYPTYKPRVQNAVSWFFSLISLISNKKEQVDSLNVSRKRKKESILAGMFYINLNNRT
jgi:hypothetical protein